MSWRYLKPHAMAVMSRTLSGAAGTLGSTVGACYLAVNIEIAAHRTIFHFFPHLYADVKSANGISQEMLESVRRTESEKVVPVEASSSALAHSSAVEENVSLSSGGESETIVNFWNTMVAPKEITLSLQGEIAMTAMTA